MINRTPEECLRELGFTPEEIDSTHGRQLCLRIALKQLRAAILDTMIAHPYQVAGLVALYPLICLIVAICNQ